MASRIGIATLLGVAVCVGCHSMRPGYERATDTAAGMGSYRTTATQSKQQIATVLTALEGVTKNISTSPRPAYEKFVQEVAATSRQERLTKASANQMSARGNEFFRRWDEQIAAIQNSDVRERATKRRETLSTEYAGVQGLRESFEASFTQFMSDLHDIEIYLGADLTPKGLDAVDDLIARVSKDGRKLLKEVDEVVDAVDDIERELVPAGTPIPSTTDAPAAKSKK